MRLPIWFGVAGALVKVALLVVGRLWESHLAFALAVIYDPVSFWLAEEGLTWFFDRRGIGPSPAAVQAYRVFLVLGLATQCLVLGIVVQAIRYLVTRRRRQRA